MSEVEEGGVIYEFKPNGAYVRVTAMHVASLVEVTVVGAASASEDYLQRLALRKLNFVMNKKEKG